MPVSGFLSSIADKAQDALNKSPLAQHIPGSITGRPTTPGEGGSTKNATLEQIQHQFRTFQIQHGYGNVSPVQRIITTEKGVALDFESVKRDAQAQSKELYMWGKAEASDLKDVTDRLAFLNYISGQLANTLANRLNAARVPLKAIRDNDAQLTPRRNVRASLQTQIDRLEQGKERGYEQRIVEIRNQLRKAEEDDAPQEREAEILKRKMIRESERLKFEALREYGEKLSLIAQASVPILDILPAVPPSSSLPYNEHEKSGNVRATLQHALDNWKPGDITLMASAGAKLDRSNTRAFGETHATELSKITTEQAGVQTGRISPVPSTTVTPSGPVPVTSTSTTHTVPIPTKSDVPLAHPIPSPGSSTSPPINPSVLNNAPAPIPTSSVSPALVDAISPVEPKVVLPTVTPTIAETGIPISAESQEPGPASGSLKDLRSPAPPPTRTAEEEKQERERLLRGGSSSGTYTAAKGPTYETAEEEKKRLEREERERLLHSGAPKSDEGSSKREDGSEGPDASPPPYQEI